MSPRDGFPPEGLNTKTSTTSVTLYPGDVELLDMIVEFLGSNRSDAMRSAIRAFAQTITTTQGRKGL